MEIIKAYIEGTNLIESNSHSAFTLLASSSLGEKSGEKITYSSYETLYLMEQNKLELYLKNKRLTRQEAIKKFSSKNKDFSTNYLVFKDLRKKGHIVKTALKLGAQFRVYEKNQKTSDHAKWLLHVFNENSKLNWHNFSGINRAAHNTNKRVLIALVDSESSISYFESNWKKI
jgi:tRNA-intron endonuclease, archaea type